MKQTFDIEGLFLIVKMEKTAKSKQNNKQVQFRKLPQVSVQSTFMIHCIQKDMIFSMMKRVKTIFLSLLCLFVLAIGAKFFTDRMKVDNLYRHGFQLYEEQIAIYLKEHYSGISKIEFSPIFISGGKGESFVHSRVIPVIYDTYGNKAYLQNGRPLDIGVPRYGTFAGLQLDFTYDGSEYIHLLNDEKEYIQADQYHHIPPKLNLKKNDIMDEVLTTYVKKGLLKGVEKNSQGSPKAEIIYNLEIRRVQGREFYEWK